MNSKFYLHASGSEKNIRALHDALSLAGSKIRITRGNSPTVLDADGNHIWIWSSSYVHCITPFPENELADYLRDNTQLITAIKEHRNLYEDFTVMIVSTLNDMTKVRGYSFSLPLINTLQTMGAGLVIDILSFPEI